MISIIVSSYKENTFGHFSKNVADTIGIPYEIVKIDNPGLMGICEAYNKGAAIAQYKYICFCHDDILFHTKNWGQNIVNMFKNDFDIGLIGIAGSRYKSYVISGWAVVSADRFYEMQLLQHQANGKIKLVDTRPNNTKKMVEVSCIDGCFMATTKEMLAEHEFDEISLSGYHAYDIDFSLQFVPKRKVVVTYDVLIEHCSTGNYGADWFGESIKLHKKWSSKLPIYNEANLKKEELKKLELNAYRQALYTAIETKVGVNYVLKIGLSTKFISITGIIDGLKNIVWSLKTIIASKAYIFNIV